MKQVNIRELRQNLSTHLEDLPFEVTKHGKVIAQVGVPKNRRPIKTKKDAIEAVKGMCKHYMMKGLCKYGCK